MFNSFGITLINIVRGNDKVENLKQNYGAKFVLNQESETFMKDLQGLIAEHKPNFTVMFECVGGELPCQIFE